jgi:hypothetical protein
MACTDNHYNCIQTLGYWDQLTIDSFTALEPALDEVITKGYKYDKFGKRSLAVEQWLFAHDLLSLYLYLSIVRLQIDRDIANCDLDTADNYYETFQLQCIIDRFHCKSSDITNIIDSFFEEFRLTRSLITSVDGIGYDHITQGCPILEVN